MNTIEAAEAILNLLAGYYPKLLQVRETDCIVPSAPGKWSRKQILGHLIDSASNNHQRLVRAQILEELSFPAYQQEVWVQLQRYHEEPWSELVALWRNYNLHLAHVIAHIREDRVNHRVTIGAGEAVTLSFLAEDYVRHLKHHLEQILP